MPAAPTTFSMDREKRPGSSDVAVMMIGESGAEYFSALSIRFVTTTAKRSGSVLTSMLDELNWSLIREAFIA
jgi:hypothetical protein